MKITSLTKLANPIDLFISAFMVFIFSGTISEVFSLNDKIGGEKIAMIGGLMLLAYAPFVVSVFNHSLLTFTFLLLFFTGVYSIINSADSALSHQLIFSFPLLILLTVVLNKNNRVQLFSFFIFVLLIAVVFSPSIVKIYTFSRSFQAVNRTDFDVLKGFSGHYIDYGMRCMMALFLAIAFFQNSKNLLAKSFFAFSGITAFIGGLTSGSKGSIVAILCGLFFFMFMIRKKLYGQNINFKKFILFFIILGCFLLWYNTFQSFVKQATVSERWGLYACGLKLFSDNVWTGIGWNGFHKLVATSQHSNWLRTFVELGVVGGIAEMIIWLMFFKIAFRSLKMTKDIKNNNFSIFIIAWSSIMFSFCVWQTYENTGLLGGTRLYYICFGVICAIYMSLSKSLAACKLYQNIKPL